MRSVFVDRTSNMAAIDLRPGERIDRTEEVGGSLLANYGTDDELVSVEILSLGAVHRPEVVAELHVLLGPLGEIGAGSSVLGNPSLIITPRRLDVVDLLIQQINQAAVSDSHAQKANALA